MADLKATVIRVRCLDCKHVCCDPDAPESTCACLHHERECDLEILLPPRRGML